MERFYIAREAKEFLVSRIVEEAMRENAPLSDVERKMLYFSETGWTLPDSVEAYEEFDRDYNQDDYEKKIARLIANATEYDRNESREQYDVWCEAVRVLKKEDHYILVMTDLAMAGNLPVVGVPSVRPRFDQLKLFVAGLSIAAALVGAGFLDDFVATKYGIHFGTYVPSENAEILIVVLLLAGVYLALRSTLGAERAGRFFSNLRDRVLRARRP